ncbi:MAG: DinB family protein [Gemmatimonadales bacterium]
MPDLNIALASNLAAARDFADATDRLGAVWTTPRAHGKWSPAQLLDHIIQTHVASGKIIKGEPVGLPNVPRLFRPLLRRFVLRGILDSGRFGRPSTTFAPFEPKVISANPAEGRERLMDAVRAFEADVRSVTPIGDFTFTHPSFGKLAVSDYVRFQEVHTRHHMKQLPAPPG